MKIDIQEILKIKDCDVLFIKTPKTIDLAQKKNRRNIV